MKKHNLLLLSLMTTTLLLSSCQREDMGATESGEVNFTVTAGIPAGITTYAEDAFSHQGGAINVDPTQYDLRYILEVYTEDENPVRVYRKTAIVPDDFSSDVTFSARLVAKKYKFVFWADFVEDGSTEDTEGLHYNTDPLTQISYKDGVSLEDLGTDMIDAYYHVEEVDLTKSQNIEGILLHRPFGKIRLIATDQLSDGAVQSEYPASVKIDYKQIEIPASFDALNEKTLETTLTIGDITSTTTVEDALVSSNTYSGAYLLGYHYIFATDATSAYEMDVTVYDQNDNVIGNRSLSLIPVEKNKLTTVIGNFYTNEGTLQVVVEDPFDAPEIEMPVPVSVNTQESLFDALENQEPNITLTSDIDLDSPISIASGATEINLNGNVLTSSLSKVDLVTVSDGTLTLKNGSISTMNYGITNGGLVADKTGTLILENVDYKTSGTGLFLQGEGSVVVKNSTISAESYCVTSNASNPAQSITVILENSTFTSSDPILLNIPSNITIDNCEMTGTMHGAIIRGGTAKISNSTLTLVYNKEDYTEIASYFENRNWSSGNEVNVAALTIGNKAPSAYQYPTNVTLENTKLVLDGTYGSYFPALYAYANQGEGLGVTLNYDESCEFGGKDVYGSENIVVNGNPVTPNEVISNE